ncbi:hypothetical protein COU78_06575 [Candidatus Peregrinibacteria bacterium CG10_big_fil_rev_8_21_14_0_10_49_24]|nr:MAG: hypothetical protein COU78_06575 [Candidatus Peregrinibacteria bacterium CG10_big_fil_rev_8_21_14_0_10_49_24]PJA67802.1 MAG: hypothetical protein CO157_02180 [Candidatus Peregrinibacteria bacterium CG_4_9_14_3_um_filter_49_12]
MVTIEADARTLDSAGGSEALSRIEAILAESNGHGHRFRLVLDTPDEGRTLPERKKGPIYGHVADDMASQFDGGISEGPIWE